MAISNPYARKFNFGPNQYEKQAAERAKLAPTPTPVATKPAVAPVKPAVENPVVKDPVQQMRAEYLAKQAEEAEYIAQREPARPPRPRPPMPIIMPKVPNSNSIADIKAAKAADAKIIAMRQAEAMADKAIAGKGMQQPETAGGGIGGSSMVPNKPNYSGPAYEPKPSPMPIPNKPSSPANVPPNYNPDFTNPVMLNKSAPPMGAKKGGILKSKISTHKKSKKSPNW